jgi:hypothetical protein
MVMSVRVAVRQRFLAADPITFATNPAGLRAASWVLHGELCA